MGFYRFSHNSSHEPVWTWAFSIHPRSHVVDWFCDTCHRAEKYPAGSFDVDVEGGSKYPDILGCGAFPLLIVSEKVVSSWKKAGISAYESFPVGIRSVKAKKLKESTPPEYYHIEITGRCTINFKASGITIKGICPQCGELTTSPPLISGFRLLEGSWDGSDLFRDQRFFPSVTFCTEKVIEIASAKMLTNFRFEPMEKQDSSSKGIPYLKKIEKEEKPE